MSVVSEVTAATRYGVAFWPWAAMVAYALATSTTCGEAVPRTLVSVSSRPAVFSGIPAAIAAFLVFAGPTLLLRPTKTVLTDLAVARRRSIIPKFWLNSFGTLTLPTVIGLLPLNWVLVLMPSWRPAISANGLNVEPACMIASVDEFSWRFWKSAPPYIATMAPSPGLMEVRPAWTSGASLGRYFWTEATAASWLPLLIVVVIRRPPRSMSESDSLSVLPSSLRTASTM